MANNVLNIELTEYTPVQSTEKIDRSGWVTSGVDNLFPYYLRDLAESSPIHGALCISIADMIAGKGVEAGRYQERVDVLITEDIRQGCASDLKKFGGYYIEVIYTVDRKSIAKLRHLPYEECRIAVTGDDEEIIGIYQSDDWANIRKKKNKPVFLPKFNKETAREEPRQVYWCFDYTGGQIYPKPDYFSAVNYIELSKQIGIYHVSNILNGMFPSLIVSFFNGQLDEDAIRKMRQDMQGHLGGARNSGKAFFTFNEPGAQPPAITSFPLSDADKQYEYLTNTSRQEVLLAHRCTTPLIFGIRDGGTGFGSNKEEMVIGLEIFTKQVIEPKQRKLANGFQLVLSYEMPDVEITIVPNTPLMTEQGATATVTSTTSTPSIAPQAAPQATEPSQEAAPVENVAATALNGAQIASMLEVIAQVTSGLIPITAAKAVMAASFPMLSSAQVDSIFQDIKEGTPPTTPAQLTATLSREKKKYTLAADVFEPTDEMAQEAALGLKWREEYGRGGTEIGVARARDISNKRNLSTETVKRMNAYFSRHEVDKQATGWKQGEEGFPTAGRIAWQLWGGDPGQAWAARMYERIQRENLSTDIYMTDEDEQYWRDRLKNCGEVIDLDEWELVHEDEALRDAKVEKAFCENLQEYQLQSLEGYAEPDKKSAWGDRGLYKLRYAYSQNISDESREFCVDMVGLSKAGTVYRYEDIQLMSEAGVNGQFAPAGESQYDLFKYVGGCFCHHHWKRQIYFRKREKGKFLPNKGLENDTRVGNVPYVKQKGIEGIAPIDRPGRGSLKYS